MIKYFYNPPLVVKKTFSNFLWNSANKKILLTFDDGPIPETTETILKLLDKNKIKAAFFCVGNNIDKYPSLVNAILAEGHTIGNHTFNHKQVTKISSVKLVEEIDLLNKLLLEKYGYKIKYFRPPHGRFNFGLNKILKDREMKNVMWSLLTYDYHSNFELYKKVVNKYLTWNSIAVLHDSLKSKDIIDRSIEFLLEEAFKKNYEIGEPAECLK